MVVPSARKEARDILLCDLDAFFASVEQRDHPEYRGRPVIVGGTPEGRGVVAACSYEARKYGVRSAMPMKKAVRLCPAAVFLPADLARYRQASKEVFSIFARFTPEVEEVSIDEAYLGVPAGRGVEIAAVIRETVRKEVDLPVSVGISCNKLLAKTACELAKPDGLRAVWPADVPEVVWPLPVSKLYGVGPRTEQILKSMGIYTIGDLAQCSESELVRRLGSFGAELKMFAQGIDYRPLELTHTVKSIGREITFEYDRWDEEEVLQVLSFLAGEVGYRLRTKGFKGRTVTVKIRKGDFSTFTRSRTLPYSTDLDREIYETARELFLHSEIGPPWRLIGLQVSGLSREEMRQLSLLEIDGEKRRQKEEELSHVVDDLRRKYGRTVVQRAMLLRKNKK